MLARHQNDNCLLLLFTYTLTTSPLLHVIVQATPSSEIIEESPTVSDVLKWNPDRLAESNDADGDVLLKRGADKRYMRFGRTPTEEKRQEEEKRYMRFGRIPADWFRSDYRLAADKRYMRFGRALGDQMNSEDYQDAEKRYMRFGRSYGSEENDIEEAKRYMRFGRDAGDKKEEDKRYMRFGRGAKDEKEEDKRYMRFGRNAGEEKEDDKRYMRFGRDTGDDKEDDKRYMRFGRVAGDDKEEDKRYMRFGRDAGDDKEKKEDKRYMRFGKRVLYDTSDVGDELEAAKRYMRFGRKLPDDFWSRNEDEISSDKRYMRFGRRWFTEDELLKNSQPDVAFNLNAKRYPRISRSVPSNQQTINSFKSDSVKGGKLPKTLDKEKDAHAGKDSKSHEKTATLRKSSESEDRSDVRIYRHSM